ncbi:MAG TPA: DUF4129 domain-containing protein [Gemmatimonadales bacterium]|nr:DUF4129 domain-containing protein [Gemmatimonadales bacterium]
MLQVPPDSLRTAIRRVFADPAYRWVRPQDPFAFLKRWVKLFVDWFFRVSDAHPLFGYAIVMALLAVLLLILVHGAFIIIRTIRKAAPAAGAGPRVRIAEKRDAAWHRRASERLMREGKFAEALMEEFWALIAELESRKLVRFQAAKTPGEYLLEAGLAPDDRSALGRLVERLYALVFAGRGCREEDVLAWRTSAMQHWGAGAR